MPRKTPFDTIRFAVPAGTEAIFKEIALLEGKTVRDWYREVLRQATEEALARHDLERELPPLHPPKPKRLQPRIKVRPSLRPSKTRKPKKGSKG